jgi:hypothetical protein
MSGDRARHAACTPRRRMRLLPFGLAVASMVAVLVACGGTDGGGVGQSTDPTVTCGDGTHRCCASAGFVCVPLSTLCARSDSECAGSTPPVDASTPPIDATSDPCAGLKRCCPKGGVECVPFGSACPNDTECTPQDAGGTDACPDTTLPACWLGPSSLPCTDDTACARTGGTCNTSIGACECQDCESGLICGSIACAQGLTCKSAYPGQHATCRCDPGTPGCAPLEG